MLEISMLSCVSFSQVRSMHSYTDCRISFGSSSTQLHVNKAVVGLLNDYISRVITRIVAECVGYEFL